MGFNFTDSNTPAHLVVGAKDLSLKDLHGFVTKVFCKFHGRQKKVAEAAMVVFGRAFASPGRVSIEFHALLCVMKQKSTKVGQYMSQESMNQSVEHWASTITFDWTSMVVYRFGPFSLFPSRYILSDNGADLQLTPRLLRVLRYLIQYRNRVVTKEELIAELWQKSFVGEENVARTVSTLRALLGDARENPKYIQTVTRVGYRFVHPVTAFYETGFSPQDVLADAPMHEDPDTVEE